VATAQRAVGRILFTLLPTLRRRRGLRRGILERAQEEPSKGRARTTDHAAVALPPQSSTVEIGGARGTGKDGETRSRCRLVKPRRTCGGEGPQEMSNGGRRSRSPVPDGGGHSLAIAHWWNQERPDADSKEGAGAAVSWPLSKTRWDYRGGRQSSGLGTRLHVFPSSAALACILYTSP
jgi:hypothetical protein